MTVYLTPPTNFKPAIEVAACYVEYQERILLLLRQSHKPQGNTWCLPGGKLDQHDTPLEAVLREVREETQIKLKPSEVTFFKSLYVVYPEMDFIYHLFHSQLRYKPQVKLSPNEHKKHIWPMPKNAITLPLTPGEDFCMKMFYRL